MYETVLAKIIAYYREELDDPNLEITAESNLMDDLSLSSLEMLKALVYLESEMKVHIPEKLLRRMVTVGDVAKIICEMITEGIKNVL